MYTRDQMTTWREHVLAYQAAHRVTYKEALQSASMTWKPASTYRNSSAALTRETKVAFSAGLYGDILITLQLNTARAFDAAAAAETKKRNKKVKPPKLKKTSSGHRIEADPDDDDIYTDFERRRLQLPASLSVTLLDDHQSTAEYGVKLSTHIPVEEGLSANRRQVLPEKSNSKSIVFKRIDFHQSQDMDLRLTMKFVSDLTPGKQALKEVTIDISVAGGNVTASGSIEGTMSKLHRQKPLAALKAKRLFERAEAYKYPSTKVGIHLKGVTH